MRLDRRVSSGLVAALTTLAVLGCSPAAAPPPAPTPSPTATPPPPKVSDLSGCEELDSQGEVGAWVVVVPIDLTLQNDGCHARIPMPSKRVCVRQGGAIVWVVGNRECDIKPADPKKPALEISEPTAKASGNKLALKCSRRIDKILKPSPEYATRTALVLCPVPENAATERYEYSVGGEVLPDDPDIEVRRGG